MISLREFKVSADDKWLMIDMEVNPSLSGVYIDAIKISCTGKFTSADTATFDTLLESAVNEYTGEVIDWTEHPTKIWLKLDVDVLKGNPFFMLVTAQDPEGVASTCGYKGSIEAVTFNKYPLFKAIACAARHFDSCEPPMAFFDYLMRLEALKASVEVKDYDGVIAYYDWLVKHQNLGYNCFGAAPVSPYMPQAPRDHRMPSPPHQPPFNFNRGCGCHH